MAWIEGIVLGFVQGMTEFLPISSSGHLVVFQKLLGYEQHNLAADVVAHVGTLLSILTVFRGVILQILRESMSAVRFKTWTPGAQLTLLIIIGSVPTALLGFTFKDIFEAAFSNIFAVAIFFCVTGILLFLTRHQPQGGMKQLRELEIEQEDFQFLTWKKAIVIGFAQGLAIAPGISRAGATIATSLFLRVPKSMAAIFSFLLSLPAICGAAILQLKDVAWESQQWPFLFVVLLSSYVFGLLGLKLVLGVLSRGRLEVFSYYLWALGLALIGTSLI